MALPYRAGPSRASDLYAAGVDIHGVHDWNVVVRNFVETYDPRTRQDAARLAFDSSPMASLDGWRSPALLIHGDDDRNVPFSETVTLAEELRKRGVEFEQLIFPDEIHGFLLIDDGSRRSKRRRTSYSGSWGKADGDDESEVAAISIVDCGLWSAD